MEKTSVRLRLIPGDIVVLMIAPNKRALEALSRSHPFDSWGRAARRMLARFKRRGVGVAQVHRALKRKGAAD